MASAHPTHSIATPQRAPAVLLPDNGGRLYARLYQRLRTLIEDGSWPPGMRLPSSRLLAEDLGMSRNTASIALEQLVAEGWADARNRSGVFVARHLPKREAPIVSAHNAVSAGVSPRMLPDTPIDLFPLRRWRTLHARIWAERGPALLEAPSQLGEPALREAIARLVCVTRGFSAPPDQVLVTAGAGAALSVIANVLRARAEDSVIYDPGMSATRRKGLLNWAVAGNGWIVERDCDGWAAGIAASPPPLRTTHGADRIIYVRSLTELLCPAIPFTFIVAPPALASELGERLGCNGIAPSRDDQLTLARFIGEGGLAAHLRRLRRALAERREWLRARLAPHAGASFTIESAAMPRHLAIRPGRSGMGALQQLFAMAGLPVTVESGRKPRLLVGYAGIGPDSAPALASRLERALNGAP